MRLMVGEKCDVEKKVRLPSSLVDTYEALARADGRTVADYMRHVLTVWAYGHGWKVTPPAADAEGLNGTQRPPRKF